MLKKVIISILLIVSAYVGFAQEESSTMGKQRIESPRVEQVEILDDAITPETDYRPLYHKVIIVPFEPKLYISEADRDIARRTGLVPAQIRNTFRYGLNNVLWAEMNIHIPTVNMLVDDPEMQKDLRYLYQSMGYHYRPLPLIKTDVGKTKTEDAYDKMKEKFSSTFNPAPEEEEEGARIKNGQIYAVNQSIERYMHTRIINDNALETIANKYEVGYFVFINQFDVKIAPGVDQRQLANEMYPREIKVHYTIMDQFGNEVYGGASKGYFPSALNDMNRIIKGHLPKVAKQIVSHMPLPQFAKPVEQKIISDQVKADKQRELIQGEGF
jgi:hypothetical protein